MKFSEYIGTMLKKRRRELGMSLEEVSSLSGISRANIANIERGTCDTSGDRLFTLLVCYQIDPRSIYDLKQQLLNRDERYCSELDFLTQKRMKNPFYSQHSINFSTCKVQII